MSRNVTTGVAPAAPFFGGRSLRPTGGRVKRAHFGHESGTERAGRPARIARTAAGVVQGHGSAAGSASSSVEIVPVFASHAADARPAVPGSNPPRASIGGVAREDRHDLH